MKKYLPLVLIVAVVMGLVPTIASAQDKPVLLIWADETRAAVIDELGTAFEEEYGVDIQVQQMGFGDIPDQLIIAGPAGEGPDIIVDPHDKLGKLVANGVVAPLDLGDAVENFAPLSISALTYDGQLYGVPYAVENVGLFYNTDLVPTPPTTWDEVRTMSKDIIDSKKADYGWVIQAGDPYHFYPVQTAFGGYIFGLNEIGGYNAEDVGVDNAGSVAALQFLQGMIADGMMPASLGGGDIAPLFQDGKAAMLITGPWNIQPFVDAGVHFAIAESMPVGPNGDTGSPFLGVQGFMISSFSKNPLLAQAFLTEFVGSEEVQLALYEKGGRMPALLSAQEKIDDPYLAALAKVAENGQPMPSIPAMDAVWSPWGQAITLVMQDTTSDAQDLATQAADAIKEAVAQ